MKRALILFALPFAACSTGGGGRTFFDFAMAPADLVGTTEDMAQMGTPDLTMMMQQDFSVTTPPDLAMGVKKSTGSMCAGNADCVGKSPSCVNMIGNFNAPGGYCSTSACAGNGDCGFQNAYCAMGGLCLGSCTAKNECQNINANNRCFYGGPGGVCLPSAFSTCNPTQKQCACLRSGIDDVGDCYSTCTLPNSCANGDNCIYFNGTIDTQGMATGDALSSLICLPPGATGANQACMYIDSCVNGYECDYFMASGSKTCRQVCKLGTTVCAAGTCKNAFKLLNFANGSIGLCF